MRFLSAAFLLMLACPAFAAGKSKAPRAQNAAPSPAASFVAPSAPAAEEKIAVVVNDAAITTRDLAARYHLALLSSGMPDTPDIKSRLMPQILRALIDEQIQLQEARRQQVNIDQSEIDKALARVAADNNIPGGDMRAFLAAHGVPPETMDNQARANLAWVKLVQRQLRPRVEIGDDEVEEALARMRANAGKQEYFVNEIFLPVDDPEQERIVHELADKLAAQVRETGAFGAIARQFSQGAGAMSGGEIGWVQEGMLAGEIDRTLAAGKKGDLIGPVKSAKGYHILAIRDTRRIAASGRTEEAGAKTVRVKFVQLNLSFTATRPKEQAMAEAAKTGAAIHGCAGLAQKFSGPDWRYQELEEKPVSDLPPPLAALAEQKIGEAGAPTASDQEATLFVLCERTESGEAAEAAAPDRTAVMNQIGMERLENMARRLLRDLKRNAYIDVRI